MIRQLRGMPGAIPERLRAGDTVRHCALSLVGEPIMYPRINDLLRELHDRHISSFLVTNAQFPEPIRTLSPVTQLYVSIDAADRDSLKAIDRPLFADFWERFQASLAALSEVCGRTVFRLTIVKDKNAGTEEHLVGYARLVAKYKPDLVEIKGVTFCGKSEASDLRMANVPWHHEVRAFSLRLCELVTRELGGGGRVRARVRTRPLGVRLARQEERLHGRRGEVEHLDRLRAVPAAREGVEEDGEAVRGGGVSRPHPLLGPVRLSSRGFQPRGEALHKGSAAPQQ